MENILKLIPRWFWFASGAVLLLLLFLAYNAGKLTCLENRN